MIAGVRITPLRRIPDDRGCIYHMLRSDDEHFLGFGEIYFSMVYPGVVKAWHLHREMTLNYAVVVGSIKLVLFDERQDSPTRGELQEIYLGELAYQLVTVPPGVWNGFRAIGEQRALVANCATHPHDPDEITYMDPHAGRIPYDWSVKDR